MSKRDENYPREPIGRIMAKISRIFLADLQRNLSHLDIDRSYYPLGLDRGRKRETYPKGTLG